MSVAPRWRSAPRWYASLKARRRRPAAIVLIAARALRTALRRGVLCSANDCCPPHTKQRTREIAPSNVIPLRKVIRFFGGCRDPGKVIDICRNQVPMLMFEAEMHGLRGQKRAGVADTLHLLRTKLRPYNGGWLTGTYADGWMGRFKNVSDNRPRGRTNAPRRH